MSISRRDLLGAGLLGSWLAVSPSMIARARAAERPRRLVVVMLRGAVDGLSVVAPYQDAAYYQRRGTIALPRPGTDGGLIDLDGRFGLHPALAPLQPLWARGRLGFVHACGSPDPTRSHFDAQHYLETAVLAKASRDDGWLNRLAAQLVADDDAFGAVSLSATLPRICSGEHDVTNVPLGRGVLKPSALDRAEVAASFSAMYQASGDAPIADAYREGLATRQRIRRDLASTAPDDETRVADNGAPPPIGFALDASQLARLMVRNPELQLAFLQLGSWDTHLKQGAARGALADRLRGLGDGLATLVCDLGPVFDDTLIVVMSEFGRTVAENGGGGTDHGHGNVIWLLGGGLKGGKVWGQWPGLDSSALYEGRDLAVTTDFRSVLQQVCAQHLRLDDRQLAAVFPQAGADWNQRLV